MAVVVAGQAAIAFAATKPSGEDTQPSADTLPETRIDSGPSGPTNVTTPSFSFSSSTSDATFACRLDANPFEPCSSPQALTDLADGPHIFFARARNADGEADPTPAKRNFVLDTDAPKIAINAGPDGPTNDPNPAFEISTPSDSAALECAIDQGAAPDFGQCAAGEPVVPEAELADGAYSFRVRATDPAGNVATAERSFEVDTESPEVVVDQGPDGSTEDPRPAFEFSSPDADATFECSIDDGTPDFRSCTGTGSDQPDADLKLGAYTFRVRATDPAGNSATAIRRFEVAEPKGGKAKQSARDRGPRAPHPVPAWYMTARGGRDLRRQARSDACAFARRQSNRVRVLLMDFGKSERHKGQWGAQLRTGPHFSNRRILGALKAAARSYRNRKRCYTQGSVRITYGNTNNVPGWFRSRTAREAGRRQSKMSKRLRTYQRRHHGFGHEGVAVAGDIEPQWSRPKISKALVSGATRKARGGLFFNYGAASLCPPETARCANEWDIGDLAKVSYGPIKRALPEIYRPVHVTQWSQVRKRYNHSHRADFCFSGATATQGFPLKIRESWKRLRARNGCVRRELVNIQEH